MQLTRAAVLGVLSAGFAAPLAADPSRAAAAPGAAGSPDLSLARLLSGNTRYRRDEAINCNRNYHRRGEIASAQKPFAVVLGCADSRVPPEVIFDQRLGDLFVVRIAGNIADDNAIGSIEYAVEHFGPSLIVVLGHEKCGAVSATLHAYETRTKVHGFVGSIVSAIEPAVARSRNERGDALRNAVHANVADVVARLRDDSNVIGDAEKSGSLRVVGAAYDLETGSVMLL